MAEGVAEIVSTIQAASINRRPDPQRDIAPSTSADTREPVRLGSPSPSELEDADVAEDEIPISVLEPQPRRVAMPPLPDLRFEQSYLKSIQNAKGWPGVLWITFRDQVFLPLAQGALWTLILAGWRHWNRASQFSGRSVGARIRRWWWEVNNWKIPTDARQRR